jgi:hypothetical protein
MNVARLGEGGAHLRPFALPRLRGRVGESALGLLAGPLPHPLPQAGEGVRTRFGPKRARKTAGFAFGAIITILASGAWAQADVAAAEALFREGKKLLEEGSFAAACPKLAESHRLDPATGTLLALAMCHESEGRTASAWAEYAEVASRARREGRADREQAARDRVVALETRLSTLTIAPSAKVAAIDGLTVKRNGAVVSAGAWQTAVPVDPGDHTIEASAPGKRPFSVRVAVGPSGDMQVVEIPQLDDLGPAPGGPPPVVAQASDGGVSGGLTPVQIGGIATSAAALVAVGVGTYFGLRAGTLNDESNGDCDATGCGPTGKQKRLDALSAGNTSTLAFVVGGALLAGGTAMFLFGGKRAGGGPDAHVTATAFADGGGLIIGGRF